MNHEILKIFSDFKLPGYSDEVYAINIHNLPVLINRIEEQIIAEMTGGPDDNV